MAFPRRKVKCPVCGGTHIAKGKYSFHHCGNSHPIVGNLISDDDTGGGDGDTSLHASPPSLSNDTIPATKAPII